MSDSRSQPASLREILRSLSEVGDGKRVQIGDITDALGPRAFGPMLLLPSLILISPISGIPGAPSIGASIIILVAVQMVLGSHSIWLPKYVRRLSLARTRLTSIASRMMPLAVVIDRMVTRRFAFLTRRPFSLLLAIPCIVLAAAMPPLELVPLSSTILAFGIFLLALALTAQDGLLGLLSLAITVAAAGAGVALLL